MGTHDLRTEATHLLALALLAREDGKIDRSEELTRLASEALARAEEIERRSRQDDDEQVGSSASEGGMRQCDE
jgi:hypothetical protein